MLPSVCGLGQHLQVLGYSFSPYGPSGRQITSLPIFFSVFSRVWTVTNCLYPHSVYFSKKLPDSQLHGWIKSFSITRHVSECQDEHREISQQRFLDVWLTYFCSVTAFVSIFRLAQILKEQSYGILSYFDHRQNYH